ncbi:hypothetical protein BAAM0499_03525 [Bifidobacterium animalis subsp. animalis MCC 0499]|nr:hypothetical protein BAAM0499_03525 [Bifidobacterium animalis subsp. animalis MCC 0499]
MRDGYCYVVFIGATRGEFVAYLFGEDETRPTILVIDDLALIPPAMQADAGGFDQGFFRSPSCSLRRWR